MTTFEIPLPPEPVEVIFENDIDLRPSSWDDRWTLTFLEWWSEFDANASALYCCPSARYAAKAYCGCGGPVTVPSNISRLLLEDKEEL